MGLQTTVSWSCGSQLEEEGQTVFASIIAKASREPAWYGAHSSHEEELAYGLCPCVVITVLCFYDCTVGHQKTVLAEPWETISTLPQGTRCSFVGSVSALQEIES